MADSTLDRSLAQAILGIDTLWGGDVMCQSGTGRFIADSWFSDAALPQSYMDPTAEAVRSSGGLSAKEPDQEAIGAYLKAVDLDGAIRRLGEGGEAEGGLRGEFLSSLAESVRVMWDLGMEVMGRGEPVAYERSVAASCAKAPTPSNPAPKREQLGSLLTSAGYPADEESQLLEAVDAWRGERMVPHKSLGTLASAFIAQLDALTVENLVPHLPKEVWEVPRSNVTFVPIENAWFSGSMNYIGRARTPQGEPEYEASYEINASLEISIPEFEELVSHEVVPGHVTTFALLQHLNRIGEVGFEATILTMNSRFSTLAEGIANNAALMAHGITELDDLPDDDLKIGMLLSRLQDDAKNQASYLTWAEKVPQPEVQTALRRDFLVSEERAEKLSGPWAMHPLLGRMYLPSYRAGTEKVAELRRQYPAAKILPALFGCKGMVDIATIDGVLE
ncbi:MAG: hypothetical protein GY906_21565 [bacterium]|nr:hypothetical protein [bacterium]